MLHLLTLLTFAISIRLKTIIPPGLANGLLSPYRKLLLAESKGLPSKFTFTIPAPPYNQTIFGAISILLASTLLPFHTIIYLLI